MANQFVAIPAPAANGSGAAVDVSTYGALKTFVASGLAGAYVTIEMSNQLVPTKWSPVTTFLLGAERTIEVAAHWLRATVTNYQGGGAPVINLGGDDSGAQFVELVAPAGNGDGAGVDVSALPAFMTVQIGGTFKGAINIEISDDAGVTWSEIVSFKGPGIQSFTATANMLRVKRNGIVFPNGPTPVVFVAAAEPIGGSGQTPATAAVVQWLVSETWDQAYAKLAAISGPKICLVEFDPSGSRTMTARAGDPTDLNQVLFMGSGCVSRQDGDGITIVVDDGFKLADQPSDFGLRCSMQSKWLSWDFQALTSAAYTTANVATDLATWTQDGGQLKGSLTAELFRGSVAMSLVNVVYKFGCVARATSEAGTLEASARSEFFYPIFDTDGGGHALSIFTDASCAWAPSGFTGGGFTIIGSVEVHNFARGPDGNSLYEISVDGGGAVIATAVP